MAKTLVARHTSFQVRTCPCGRPAYPEANHLLSLAEPNTLFAALVDLKDQITGLLSLQAALRARYVPTIARFPPELLTQIFSYLALGYGRQDIRRWHSFSQVCARWRQVALTSPGLWTQPDFSQPPLVEKMLVRSGNLPLDFHVGNIVSVRESGKNFCALEAALNHWSRVRTLIMACDKTAFVSFIAPKLFKSKSLLEYLDITLSGRNGRMHDFAFLPKTPESHCTALRSLRLNNCSISWPSLSSLDLTELVLICSWANPAPDWSVFFTAIRSMRSLQVLELSLKLPEHIPDDSQIMPVQLLRLSRLKVSTCWPAVFSVIRHISFPPNCSVVLCPEIELEDGEDDFFRQTLLEYIDARRPTHGQKIPSRCLTMHYHDDTTRSQNLTMTLSAGLADPDHPPFTLQIDETYQIVDLYGSGRDSGWLQRIEILVLNGCFEQLAIDSGWEAFYDWDAMPSVHTLVLRGAAFSSFIFASAVQPGVLPEYPKFGFRSLRSIVLRSVKLTQICREYAWDDGYHTSVNGEHRCMDLYLEAFRRWVEAEDLPFAGELRFEGCSGYDELGGGYLEQLRAVVGTVSGWGCT